MSILLGLLIGAPFTSALLWRTATLGSRHSFWGLFAYAFGVLFIFNLVDLLILDWLIVCYRVEFEGFFRRSLRPRIGFVFRQQDAFSQAFLRWSCITSLKTA
jgi:hypothetical protein